mgnify:CR=1 FL=1
MKNVGDAAAALAAAAAQPLPQCRLHRALVKQVGLELACRELKEGACSLCKHRPSRRRGQRESTRHPPPATAAPTRAPTPHPHLLHRGTLGNALQVAA